MAVHQEYRLQIVVVRLEYLMVCVGCNLGHLEIEDGLGPWGRLPESLVAARKGLGLLLVMIMMIISRWLGRCCPQRGNCRRRSGGCYLQLRPGLV